MLPCEAAVVLVGGEAVAEELPVDGTVKELNADAGAMPKIGSNSGASCCNC